MAAEFEIQKALYSALSALGLRVYDSAPQSADGLADPRGIRSFVVGTGGVHLTAARPQQPNSEVRNNQTWGVLKLTLRARDYAWEFVPIDGQAFRDSGSAACLAPEQ